MKTNKLVVPISMTAAVVGLMASAVSCAKKNNSPPPPSPGAPQASATNGVTDNTSPILTNSMAAAGSLTNAQAPSEITNPPPAETTTTTAETNAAATETNLPGHNTVVEMPTTTPVAPTNFYPASMTGGATLKPIGSVGGNTNLYVRFRAGYDHMYHGDNNDSYRVSVKVYAYGDDLREQAGKNAWLIPDSEAEIASGLVAKPDNYHNEGSDEGLQFRANFTWPWFHWTALSGNPDSVTPLCQPLTLGLGPTLNLGFDHLYDESDYRFARYAGVRLTFNRNGFIEYTVGDTDGLSGTRQQVVTELPIYESRDCEVRYYLRGLWNRGNGNHPDILEGGLFLEMPFTTLFSPEKWGDLVPFAQ